MQTIETTTSQQSSDALANIRAPITDDINALDQLIHQELISDIPLIQQITKHILSVGGKRLRPLLVLLSAKALGYKEGSEHCELAAIIEFVHTATLLHDDVVDESSLRRGQQTANVIWGNQASVLVGDFLYSRAFQLLTRRNHNAIMRVLANTTNAIAEGEVLQLMNSHNPEINEATYRDVILLKTAKLFESATEVGGMLGTDNIEQQKAIAHYGLHLGMAFQIIDDLLDYASTAKEMGKNVGDDLAEGKATLPLIYALHHATAKQATQIRLAIEQGDLEKLPLIQQAIEDTQACEYTLSKARDHAHVALNALELIPDTPYRNAMRQLVDFVVERHY